MESTEWSADDVRLINDVLPDGLAFSDLPGELQELDPDDLVEFFQVAN